MKLSSVVSLLSGSMSAKDFSAEMAAELEPHLKGLSVVGGIAPVVSVEDADVLLDPKGLAELCRLFTSGELTAEELAYTVDVLQMSDRAECSDQSVVDDLFLCGDPDINGPMTVERASEIANRNA